MVAPPERRATSLPDGREAANSEPEYATEIAYKVDSLTRDQMQRNLSRRSASTGDRHGLVEQEFEVLQPLGSVEGFCLSEVHRLVDGHESRLTGLPFGLLRRAVSRGKYQGHTLALRPLLFPRRAAHRIRLSDIPEELLGVRVFDVTK